MASNQDNEEFVMEQLDNGAEKTSLSHNPLISVVVDSSFNVLAIDHPALAA